MSNRVILPLALLLIAFSSLSAITITGTVAGYNTMLPGAKVELLSEGALFMETTAASGKLDYARYTFENVPDGIYILRASRYNYATHVRIVNATAIAISGDSLDIVMSKLFTDSTSPGSAYGKITAPVPLEGRIYFWKGNSAKWGEVMPDGQFVITSLSPGTYMINITRGEYYYTGEATLEDAEAKLLFITLNKMQPPVPEDTTPKISGTLAAEQGGVISVSVTRGGKPAPGASIEATTPAGKTTLVSDSDGKASITAVDAGAYSFKFENTTFTSFARPNENASAPSAPKPSVQPPFAEPQPSAKETLPLPLVLAGIAIAAIAGISFAAFIFWKLLARVRVHKPPEYAAGTERAMAHHAQIEQAGHAAAHKKLPQARHARKKPGAHSRKQAKLQ